MFNDFFSLVFDGCSRRKRLITGLAAVLTVAAAIGLESISLENDLELMLPGDEQVRRSMRFLRESRFSDDVVVSLGLRSPGRSPADLIRASGSRMGHWRQAVPRNLALSCASRRALQPWSSAPAGAERSGCRRGLQRLFRVNSEA